MNKGMSLILACLCILLSLCGCNDSTVNGSFKIQGSFSAQGSPLSDVSCTLTSQKYGTYQATSAADGTFSYSDIWDGTYTLTVAKAGYIITPSEVTVTVSDADVTVSPFSFCYTWSVTYGHSLSEKAEAMVSDGNGGYVIAGSTTSMGLGNCDGYIAHFDAAGTLLWEKAYGGTDYDVFSSIARTTDGGYIAVGTTESYTPAASTHGGSDIWIVKIHADGSLDTVFNGTGEMCIGTANDEYGAAVIQDKAGNYVVAGTVVNWNNANELSDFYIAIINTSGTVLAFNTYGDDKWEESFALCESVTTSGVSDGYIIAGTRETSLGNYDIAVLKFSTTLDTCAWEEVIDHGADDEAKAVAVLSDGTVVVTGYITASNGSTDIWTGLFSPSGKITKEMVSGGSSDDSGSAILPLSSGGFIITGSSVNTDQNRGDSDYYIAEYHADGTLQWSSTYDSGSTTDDTCVGVVPVSDGYVLGGYSYLPNTQEDIWLIKISLSGQYEGK